jgi:hypothetical protein
MDGSEQGRGVGFDSCVGARNSARMGCFIPNLALRATHLTTS